MIRRKISSYPKTETRELISAEDWTSAAGLDLRLFDDMIVMTLTSTYSRLGRSPLMQWRHEGGQRWTTSTATPRVGVSVIWVVKRNQIGEIHRLPARVTLNRRLQQPSHSKQLDLLVLALHPSICHPRSRVKVSLCPVNLCELNADDIAQKAAAAQAGSKAG